MLRHALRQSLRAQVRRFSSAARDYGNAPPLLIRNGLVVNHDGMFKADVLTRNGKIEKVGALVCLYCSVCMKR